MKQLSNTVKRYVYELVLDVFLLTILYSTPLGGNTKAVFKPKGEIPVLALVRPFEAFTRKAVIH